MATEASYLATATRDWVDGLTDPDPFRRRLAAYALGEIGSDAASAVPALAAALDDPAPFVRVWAAAALLRVDPHHEPAVAALIAGMSAEQYFVRSLAAWHVGRLASQVPRVEACLPALQRLGSDPDASVRAEAELALRALHRGGMT